MIIFLAGVGSSGSLKSLWYHKEFFSAMNVYLAGQGYNKIFLSAINVHLTGQGGRKEFDLSEDFFKDLNILESYYYLRDTPEFIYVAKKCGNFLLDSGAFSFLNGVKDVNIDWDKYTEEYANFVKKHDIKLFIEMDIDSLVGLDEVERLRRKLESITGRKPIPVWHKNRGKDYFIKMCEEYPYVALGGVVIKEIPRDKYEKIFPWFINEAHKHGCKIHGLGYSSVKNLSKYKFDSVDSASWLSGNRGGFLYQFDPKNCLMKQIKRNGRLKSKAGAFHNFLEWIKFAKYAKIYL